MANSQTTNRQCRCAVIEPADSQLMSPRRASAEPRDRENHPEILTRVARLRGIDLNLLPSLYALLHFRNVTIAAAHLSVAQPTMSGDLRRLRRLFADELLLRAGRDYVLTALGQALLPEVADLVRRLDATISVHAGFDPPSAIRGFSIAMSDYAASLLLPALADTLTSHAPGIRLSVHAPGIAPLKQLERNEFDMMIGLAEAANDEAIRSIFLFEDHWVCVTSADNPDVRGEMSLELFEQLPHLEAGFGTPPRSNLAEQAYHHIGRHSWVPFSTESPALTPYLLLSTRLVALAPERLVARSKVSERLKVFPPPFSTPVLEEVLYWNRVNDADPGHAWLRDMLVRVGRDLAGTRDRSP